MWKGNLVNGKREGYWEFYYPNGKLRKKGNLVNDNRHGYWEAYYSNGQLISKGNYVNGKREGYWEEYWSGGQLESKGNYVNGRFQKEKPVTELTMDEIVKKFEILVEQLRIKHTNQ
jgi:antitoxin component YwqK of YwqJK toxin-antitoxin module